MALREQESMLCTKCGEWKSLVDFPYDKRTSTGISKTCNRCKATTRRRKRCVLEGVCPERFGIYNCMTILHSDMTMISACHRWRGGLLREFFSRKSPCNLGT